MTEPARKPPAMMEKRTPRSIRYTDSEWAEFTNDAIERHIEVTKWVRRCSIAGRGYLKTQEALENHSRASA